MSDIRYALSSAWHQEHSKNSLHFRKPYEQGPGLANFGGALLQKLATRQLVWGRWGTGRRGSGVILPGSTWILFPWNSLPLCVPGRGLPQITTLLQMTSTRLVGHSLVHGSKPRHKPSPLPSVSETVSWVFCPHWLIWTKYLLTCLDRTLLRLLAPRSPELWPPCIRIQNSPSLACFLKISWPQTFSDQLSDHTPSHLIVDTQSFQLCLLLFI